MKLSFVVPCYHSEKTIARVVEEIQKEVLKRASFDYEIILVNDGSPDNVWHVIEELSESNSKIIGINLSRNFGQHSALLAGYNYCSGDYIISLDDDGQTPLESIYDLVDKLNEGYDVVFAYYNDIRQKNYRKLGTFAAKKLAEKLFDKPSNIEGSSFYIARKYIIDEMINYKGSFPYMSGLIFRTTQNITCIPAKQRDRINGKSGYSFFKLLSLWGNGCIGFSTKPIEICFYLGFFNWIISAFILIISLLNYAAISRLLFYVYIIIIIILIISGTMFFMLGLIGEYVGRLYIDNNNAPQFVIKETCINKK